MAEVSIFWGSIDSRLLPKSDGCPACIERICAVIAGGRILECRKINSPWLPRALLQSRFPVGDRRRGPGSRVLVTALRSGLGGWVGGFGGRRSF